MKRGFETIQLVLTILIVLLMFYIVTTQFFPKYRFLVGVVTHKTVQNIQLAVRQCQAFHEELNFLENMVDQVGVRDSIGNAGLNYPGAEANCDSGSTPAECIAKCVNLLKLYSYCAKYYPPSEDCYKDTVARKVLEE